MASPFKQASAGGGAPERLAAAPPARSGGERDDDAADAEIAPEIAFLAAEGVGPDLMRRAMRAATRAGVHADAALLGEGLVAEEVYFRALARRLGLPYFSGDLAIADDIEPGTAIATGVAPLAPNRARLRAVVAPRGEGVRLLLAASADGRLRQGGFAIASPQRFAARVREKAGQRLAEAAASALERRDAELSAHSGLSRAQIVVFAALAATAVALERAVPGTARTAVSVALWLVFGAWIVLRNLAVAAAGAPRAAPPLDDEALPVYSIVAPLYREARVVRNLVAALDALDYPRAKLDIKLVVERRDAETRAAIAALGLPARYDVVVAPDGQPSTKPRALNIALPALRGENVVVYDAEDEPDPQQLRLAAARFAADAGLDCLQARLTIANAEDSWISKLFAIEYAALFDLVDPGLAALRLPIALGGTSNHFRVRTLRRIGGWDAWNVAEDADIGIRLARERGRVGALASDTREEAPNDIGAWFRQRVRWQKGWMQTLIVHSRHPAKFFAALGPSRGLAAAALIAGSILGGLFGPALLADALWRAATGDLAHATSARVAADVAIYTLMASGLLTILAPSLAAMYGRGLSVRDGALALTPLYYALISAATWVALFDLAIRPFYWAKTEHGRARAQGGQRGVAQCDAASQKL